MGGISRRISFFFYEYYSLILFYSRRLTQVHLVKRRVDVKEASSLARKKNWIGTDDFFIIISLSLSSSLNVTIHFNGFVIDETAFRGPRLVLLADDHHFPMRRRCFLLNSRHIWPVTSLKQHLYPHMRSWVLSSEPRADERERERERKKKTMDP